MTKNTIPIRCIRKYKKKDGSFSYHAEVRKRLLPPFDENRLLEITRHTKEGDLLYTHAYKYDSMGYPIEEKLIGNLGEITYTASHDCHVKALT